MLGPDYLIIHEKQATLNQIFKQTKPGEYGQIDDDYIKKLFENRVPQLEKNPLNLTSNFYRNSSKPACKSSPLPIPAYSTAARTQTPFYSPIVQTPLHSTYSSEIYSATNSYG